jgi:hypothetical protein
MLLSSPRLTDQPSGTRNLAPVDPDKVTLSVEIQLMRR